MAALSPATMTPPDEKPSFYQVADHSDTNSAEPLVQNVFSVPLAAAEAKQKTSPWNKGMLKLYIVMIIPILHTIASGVTGGTGGITGFKQFRAYMGIDLEKGTPSTSFVALSDTIGTVLGHLVFAPLVDGKGRKWGLFIGSVIKVISILVSAASQNLNFWVAARVFLAFGNTIAGDSFIVWTLEILHPSYRGPQYGFIASFYLIGQIAGVMIPYGTIDIDSTWAWRIPVLATAVFPILALLYIPFVPESPRWLISNNRFEEAHAFLTKYHGNGDPDSPIVHLELEEMRSDISPVGSDKRWWDYRECLNSREAVIRVAQAFGFLVISQWAGNAAVSYYYPLMLKSVGITDAKTPFLITAIQSPIQWVAAVLGAYFTDRLGRRRQVMIGSACFSVCFAIVTALTATNTATNDTGSFARSPDSAKAFIAMLFLFGLIFCFFITPIQLLFVLECLRFQVRAKAFALVGIATIPVGFYNNFVTSIALAAIRWKYYYVFIFWNVFVVGLVYFFFVETSNRTLEELTEIFKARHPVKTSLSKSKIVVQGDEIILHEEDRVYEN